MRDHFLWCYGAAAGEPRPRHQNALRDYVRDGVWCLLGELTGGVRRRLTENVDGQIREGDTFLRRESLIKEQRGFFEFPPGSMVGLDLPRGVRDEPFTVTPAYRDGIRGLARICEENHIKFVVRLARCSPVKHRRTTMRLAAWSRELRSQCPDVLFSQPAVLQFDRAFLWDKRHCNSQGAEKFTAFIADLVQQTCGDLRSAANPPPR